MTTIELSPQQWELLFEIAATQLQSNGQKVHLIIGDEKTIIDSIVDGLLKFIPYIRNFEAEGQFTFLLLCDGLSIFIPQASYPLKKIKKRVEELARLGCHIHSVNSIQSSKPDYLIR